MIDRLQKLIKKMIPLWLIKRSPGCEQVLSEVCLGEKNDLWSRIKRAYHYLYCLPCYKYAKCNDAIEGCAEKLNDDGCKESMDRINKKATELLDDQFPKSP